MQNDDVEKGRQAGAIEITQEMIEAGTDVLILYGLEPFDPYSQVVSEIYREMELCRRGTEPKT